MSEIPSKAETTDSPTTPKPDKKPTSLWAKFWKFARRWGFLGGAALVCLSWYWAKIQDTVIAPWLVAIFSCFLVYVSAHNLFKRWLYRIAFSAFIGGAIILGTFLLIKSSEKPYEPERMFKFRLVVADRDGPDDLIEITNHVRKDIWSPFPVLFIPTKIGQSNFAIRFIAQNISSQAVENIEFVFQCPPTVPLVPNVYWRETKQLEVIPSETPMPTTNVPFLQKGLVNRAVTYVHELTIFSKKGEILPRITLKTPSSPQHCGLRMFSQTKTSPSEKLSFEVVFVPTPRADLPKPFWQTAHVNTNNGAVNAIVPFDWLSE